MSQIAKRLATITLLTFLSFDITLVLSPNSGASVGATESGPVGQCREASKSIPGLENQT